LEAWLVNAIAAAFGIGLIVGAFLFARDMRRIINRLSKKRVAFCPICKNYYQDIEAHLCHLKD
jgi:hypothetical protein